MRSLGAAASAIPVHPNAQVSSSLPSRLTSAQALRTGWHHSAASPLANRRVAPVVLPLVEPSLAHRRATVVLD
jgi:hypothetical protein